MGSFCLFLNHITQISQLLKTSFRSLKKIIKLFAVHQTGLSIPDKKKQPYNHFILSLFSNKFFFQIRLSNSLWYHFYTYFEPNSIPFNLFEMCTQSKPFQVRRLSDVKTPNPLNLRHTTQNRALIGRSTQVHLWYASSPTGPTSLIVTFFFRKVTISDIGVPSLEVGTHFYGKS